MLSFLLCHSPHYLFEMSYLTEPGAKLTVSGPLTSSPSMLGLQAHMGPHQPLHR